MFMQLSLEVNKKESGMRAYSAGAEERQGFGKDPLAPSFELSKRRTEEERTNWYYCATFPRAFITETARNG